MTRYLLDTNHISGVWKRDPRVLSRIDATSDGEFSLCLPSIGELWYMVFNSTQVARNEVGLVKLLDSFVVWPFDAAAAKQFGRIKTSLRRIGRPIPDVDVQIAAVTIANGLTLLSADAHFAHVQGLRVENWLNAPS